MFSIVAIQCQHMESLSSPDKIKYIKNFLLYQESEADEDKILEVEQFFRTKH